MSNRVNLYVQPAYNYESKNVEYLEVLVRGYRGFDSVKSILKFVEMNKLERVFDLDILNETLRILNCYEKLSCPVGVNLCPATIAIDNMADIILDIIENNNTSGNDIIIEINEKTEFKNKVVRHNMKKLRENGVKIALDDFGVEGANLYTLLGCNIDILKVDRAFIDNTQKEYEESQSKILRNLIQLCRDFNLKHIVEGIETETQLNNIERIGYSIVQGYLYEKPMPLVKFLDETVIRKEEAI